MVGSFLIIQVINSTVPYPGDLSRIGYTIDAASIKYISIFLTIVARNSK